MGPRIWWFGQSRYHVSVNHAVPSRVLVGMTARRSGVENESDVIWVPALARGLIREDVLRVMQYRDGYTDLLGSGAPARRSLAQRAMNSPVVAAIYQHIWRPIMVAVMSLHGVSLSAERERAAAALHLGGRQRILDVACGPGNFTSFFAGRLEADGFVIGLDSSVPMLGRAVRDNSCARAVYMRGNALDLPFNDRAFDVVSCFAALHLVPEPFGVLHEMVRVLSPGGRIAVMTTYGRGLDRIRIQEISCRTRFYDGENDRLGRSSRTLSRDMRAGSG
jgi:SAM-dependent methyltransferase